MARSTEAPYNTIYRWYDCKGQISLDDVETEVWRDNYRWPRQNTIFTYSKALIFNGEKNNRNRFVTIPFQWSSGTGITRTGVIHIMIFESTVANHWYIAGVYNDNN